MDPFTFQWSVDQDGYVIEHRSHGDMFFTTSGGYDAVSRRGGPDRFYRALEIEGLWLRCAETCRSRDGVLTFANEFGLLSGEKGTPLDHFVSLAHRLSEIAERLQAGDRRSAAVVFKGRDHPLLNGWPLMYGAVLPSAKRPGGFEWRLIPSSLRDALLLQAAEAIAGNRSFRRCRNNLCPNWFRLGPRSASEGRKTYTKRREFCSDRCRVAWARRHKREASAHA
jgi:hypothetical protein